MKLLVLIVHSKIKETMGQLKTLQEYYLEKNDMKALAETLDLMNELMAIEEKFHYFAMRRKKDE